MEIIEKKQEILKAAADCFARYGYEKTTLEDIGKLVGLNKASLYYYYKNKESIYSEVICIESEYFLNDLKEKISKIEGCSEKILTYISERFKYLEKTMNLHQLSIETTQKYQSFFKSLIDAFFKEEVEIINEILECCMKKGEIIACDTKRIAGSILTVSDAIKMKAFQCTDYNFKNKFDYSIIEDEVKFTVTLILNGIKKQ